MRPKRAHSDATWVSRADFDRIIAMGSPIILHRFVVDGFGRAISLPGKMIRELPEVE